MKNLSIKKIALYGFITLFIGVILSFILIFNFLGKIEKFNFTHDTYETSYSNLFEFKYYTERLLVSHDLTKEKELWLNSKNKFKNSIEILEIKDKKIKNIIFNFWKVIDSESKKVYNNLNNKIFNSSNTMEKSLLRRLGEGINSNKQSDYYISILNLKQSIDYLKQYPLAS